MSENMLCSTGMKKQGCPTPERFQMPIPLSLRLSLPVTILINSFSWGGMGITKAVAFLAVSPTPR